MNPQHIIVTDGFTLNPVDNPWSDIDQLGALTVYDRTAPVELIPRCREAEVLIVNKTPVRRFRSVGSPLLTGPALIFEAASLRLFELMLEGIDQLLDRHDPVDTVGVLAGKNKTVL